MKSLSYRWTLLLGVTLTVCFISVLVGCSKLDSRLEQVKTPLWNDSDLEARKLKDNQSAYVYVVETHRRPKYYKGRMPLKYEVAYPPWGLPGYAYGSEIHLFHDFGDFRNWFIYQGSTVVGVRTQDKRGRLLAEARLRYFVTDVGRQGFEAEEIHYGSDGKPVFFCKSEISEEFSEEFKVAEKDRIGRKARDYYFIWPTR